MEQARVLSWALDMDPSMPPRYRNQIPGEIHRQRRRCQCLQSSGIHLVRVASQRQGLGLERWRYLSGSYGVRFQTPAQLRSVAMVVQVDSHGFGDKISETTSTTVVWDGGTA